MAETIEVAKTGRARCRVCREPIVKGALAAFGGEVPDRAEREVELGGMARPGAGYLHPACAGGYLEEEDLMAALRKNSRGPSDSDLALLEQEVAG